MTIITSRSDIKVIQLLLNVKPDLTILQIRIELYDLHSLLLFWCKIMKIKSDTIE